LVRVLRFPNAQAQRRRASAPAAGVLVALAAASAVALDLGGPREALAGPRWNGVTGSIAPLKWLRDSSHQFQRLMHMLAERSARLQGPPASRPAYPAFETWEPERPPEGPQEHHEPHGAEEAPARPPPPPPHDAEPHQPWKRGGEAKAGRDRTTTVRAEVWRPHPRPYCWRAGVPVRGAGWYVVGAGDTLSSIAELHYGNGRAYRRIYRANWRTIFDPDVIYVCQRLYIPRHGASWPPFEDRHGRRR
jgi:nucleoid-associated protein YgaU